MQIFLLCTSSLFLDVAVRDDSTVILTPNSLLRPLSHNQSVLSGFAIVAMVELQLPEGRNDDVGRYDNDPVIVLFAVTSVLLVVVHLFALMVSTCVLPYLDQAVEDAALELDRQLGDMAHDGTAFPERMDHPGPLQGNAKAERSDRTLATSATPAGALSFGSHSQLAEAKAPNARSVPAIVLTSASQAASRAPTPPEGAAGAHEHGGNTVAAPAAGQSLTRPAHRGSHGHVRAASDGSSTSHYSTPPPSPPLVAAAPALVAAALATATAHPGASMTLAAPPAHNENAPQPQRGSITSLASAGLPEYHAGSSGSAEGAQQQPQQQQQHALLAEERLRTYQSFGRYIETSWIFATVLGTYLFLLELGLLCHLKFVAHTPLAGWIGLGVLVPCTFIFMWFAIVFYSRVVIGQTSSLHRDISDLERLHTLAHVVVEDGHHRRPYAGDTFSVASGYSDQRSLAMRRRGRTNTYTSGYMGDNAYSSNV